MVTKDNNELFTMAWCYGFEKIFHEISALAARQCDGSWRQTPIQSFLGRESEQGFGIYGSGCMPILGVILCTPQALLRMQELWNLDYGILSALDPLQRARNNAAPRAIADFH